MNSLQIGGRAPLPEGTKVIVPASKKTTENITASSVASSSKTASTVASTSNPSWSVLHKPDSELDPKTAKTTKRWIALSEKLENAKKGDKAIEIAFKQLNGYLGNRNFIASSRSFSSVDQTIYGHVRPHFAQLSGKQQQQYPSLARWIDFLQHVLQCEHSELIKIRVNVPPTNQLKALLAEPLINQKPVIPKPAPKKQQPKKQQPKQQQPKKKQNKASSSNSAASTLNQTLFSTLNIVVGKVVKVEIHPNADSMYLEKIDMGGKEPVQVVSGLRDHISIEDFTGMHVLCLANLPKARLRRIDSFAMVLCASDEAHKNTEVLEVDPSVPLGTRLTVEGHEADPLPQLPKRKKYWEQCAPDLKVGADSTVVFQGKPLKTPDGKVVKAKKSPEGYFIG